MTSTFLVVFMVLTIFVYHSTSPKTLSSAILSPLIACAFGGTATILLTILLPKAAIPVNACNKDSYVFKKAFRLAIIINVSFLLSYFFHVQNVIWVVASAIVIVQQNIGASIKRSGERLLGTFIGIVVGTILAHFIFRHYPYTLFSAYILIFFAFLFLQCHYVLSMSFFVLLLAIGFFLLKPPYITVNYFLVARLFDTLLGIVIGLMGELFIFPRSLLNDVRSNIKEILLKFSQTLYTLSVSNNKNRVETHLAAIEQLIALLKQKLNDYRYEPLTMLSKRRYYIHQLYQLLVEIYQEMLNLNYDGAKQAKQSIDCLSFNDLHEAIKSLAGLSLDQSSEKIDQCLIILERQSQYSNTESIRAETLSMLNKQIKQLALLYQTILRTPCWLPRWT
ncbi:MAG: FUSC family protein [Pseudomonadota bacterium]